jgi:hypothetical protein
MTVACISGARQSKVKQDEENGYAACAWQASVSNTTG